MGYGVPAAVGAKIAFPDRPVIACAGDGCFMMSVQELATANQYGAAVIFLVFNNGMYGTIRMHQEKHYPGRLSGTDLINPDFVALAQSMGLAAWRAESTAAFQDAFGKARREKGPSLIEIIVDPEAITPSATVSDITA